MDPRVFAAVAIVGALAAWGGWALDGMDSFIYALVLPPAITELLPRSGLDATPGNVARYGSLLFALFLFGWGCSMIWGPLADRFGRVRTLQITVLWFSLATFASAFAQNFEQFLVLKAIQGFGFGGEWAAGAVLMAESIRASHRGKAMGTVQSAWAVGWGAAVLLYALTYSFIEPDLAWRVMFAAGLLPALLIIYIRRGVQEPVPAAKPEASANAMPISRFPLLDIFRPQVLRMTLIGGLLGVGAHGGYYALMTWLPTYLKTERHLSVLGTGGYVSGPVSFAAWVLRIPLLLQEQNSIPGVTNRLLSRIANEVHLSFLEARSHFPRRDHLKVTGNPVRSYLLSGDREPSLREFKLSTNKPTLFIFGGSLGAKRINAAAVDALRRLKGRVDVQCILQTGKEDLESVKATVAAEELPATVLPFVRKMHLAYAAADLVVCRAGAMTLAEIAVCGRPSILVPYPFAAHDHQRVNAQNLADRGAAVVIEDAELTGERLAKEVAHLLADRTALSRMSANARLFARPDAAARLARALVSWGEGRHGEEPAPVEPEFVDEED